MPAYTIRDGSIVRGSRTILRDLNLSLEDYAITAIVGPGGVGKTSLLNALRPGPLPIDTSTGGVFELRGSDRAGWPAHSCEFVAQRAKTCDGLATLAQARVDKPSLLLLDEPCDDGRVPETRSVLHAVLQEQRERGAALFVSHNLDLVQRESDFVCLLCAGVVDTLCTTAQFFEDPPTALAQRFTRDGNCWPTPGLPSHFHWVRPGLAGMGRPGLLRDIELDLTALASVGIELLVSLTESRPPVDLIRAHGIESRHFPICDMGIPSLHRTATLCAEVHGALTRGGRVALHCDAGLGRTGTMLASFLVWSGSSAAGAIEEVRGEIRGALQTAAQLSFVERFADMLGRQT